MTSAPATLTELMATLAAAPQEMPAVFQTKSADIGAGYHITELKLADIDSVDCGGRRRRWSEAQMQLLDGQDGEALTVRKIAAILQRCLTTIPALANAPLSVEFAHRNRGLGRYQLGNPVIDRRRLSLPMVADRAHCKPAVEMGCCDASEACCG